MAIKHVVTRGFGFSDGTGFIPTRGYTPGEAVAIAVAIAWTLQAKEIDWTLKAKDIDWETRTKSIAWTLKDR